MTEDLIARIQHRADDPLTRTDNAGIALPPRFPPVSGTELARSERRLGFRLPSFLAAVYQQVGNGGFGPGYGLIGLPSGFAHDDGKSIVELYESYHITSPEDPTWQWPDGLVPLCDWGCAIFSCVNCQAGSVITFDPGEQPEGAPMTLAFAQSHATIADWFEDWVNGIKLWDKMFERDLAGGQVLTNPFTREPMVVHKRRLRR
jgi:hypothetical protein